MFLVLGKENLKGRRREVKNLKWKMLLSMWDIFIHPISPALALVSSMLDTEM